MRKKVSQNETPQDLLENYRSRIAKEGWLKAALCGASVGFGADILCAFAFWVFGIKLFWVCGGNCNRNAAVLFLQIQELPQSGCFPYRYAGIGRENPDHDAV